jgi:hypothetical protein
VSEEKGAVGTQGMEEGERVDRGSGVGGGRARARGRGRGDARVRGRDDPNNIIY